MDRRTKCLCKIIFCLLISVSVFAQGPKPPKKTTDSILAIKDSYGFTRYSISPDRMVEFYVYERNLKMVSKELQVLRSQYDTLTIKNEKVEKKFKEEEANLLKTIKIYQDGMEDCKKTSENLNSENKDLYDSNERLKKRQWRMYGLGVATPVVIIAVVVKTVLIK